MSNRLYDAIKFIAQIFLPALGALYFALAGIWGFPAVEEVMGSILAVDTFLGALLKVSANAYDKSDAKYNGVVNITETEDKIGMSLELHEDPEDLTAKKEILFRVNPPH